MTASEPDIMRLRGQDVSWRTVGDEVIVLDGRSWAYLSVNESGERLWKLLTDGATESQLVSALVTEFDVDEARARDDVRAFVAALRAQDLLEPAP